MFREFSERFDFQERADKNAIAIFNYQRFPFLNRAVQIFGSFQCSHFRMLKFNFKLFIIIGSKGQIFNGYVFVS